MEHELNFRVGCHDNMLPSTCSTPSSVPVAPLKQCAVKPLKSIAATIDRFETIPELVLISVAVTKWRPLLRPLHCGVSAVEVENETCGIDSDLWLAVHLITDEDVLQVKFTKIPGHTGPSGEMVSKACPVKQRIKLVTCKGTSVTSISTQSHSKTTTT